LLDVSAEIASVAAITLHELLIRRRAKMKKPEIRRAVIREWMALPRDRRQTGEQTADFAAKAVQRHELPRSRRDPQRVITDWLLPRTGKP
jgi:hypothetical protein